MIYFYIWADVDALANLYAAEFTRNADEVLAALFGCPHGREWAFPDRAAIRAAIRSDHGKLAEQIARDICDAAIAKAKGEA